MIHAILAFIAAHLLHALIGGGITAALGIGGSMLGWPVVLKYWKDIVGFICLALIAVLTLDLYAKLKETQADLAKSEANFVILQGQAEVVNRDNANLVAQLKTQDDSITQAAQADLATQASLKLQLAAAQASHAPHKAVIARYQARSQVNEGSCDDEIAVLRAGK